jgi:hypothetical protein
MIFVLIFICVIATSFLLFKLVDNNYLKYLLTFVISPIYGIFVLFIGFVSGEMSMFLYAITPILIGIFLLYKR